MGESVGIYLERERIFDQHVAEGLAVLERLYPAVEPLVTDPEQWVPNLLALIALPLVLMRVDAEGYGISNPFAQEIAGRFMEARALR